jgi:hypothetical protein
MYTAPYIIEVLNVKVGVDDLSVLLVYYFSRHYITDCSQNQTAVSDTLHLLSDF